MASQKGIIVVSVNYRLAVWGFSTWRNSDGSINGNNGYKDQQEALRWVQSHIAAFGGDKNWVTIWGQSSGGMSIAAHLVSPLSAELFHAAMLDSPNQNTTISVQGAIDNTMAVMTAAGCSTLEACTNVNISASHVLGTRTTSVLHACVACAVCAIVTLTVRA